MSANDAADALEGDWYMNMRPSPYQRPDPTPRRLTELVELVNELALDEDEEVDGPPDDGKIYRRVHGEWVEVTFIE